MSTDPAWGIADYKAPETAAEVPDDQNQELRAVFERWISATPYELCVSRLPMDERKTAWPGQYRDISVQLAWEAWCASAESHLE